MWITSPWLLEIGIPFSLGMLLELLLGELGPEPGALLHAGSEIENKHKTLYDLRITFIHALLRLDIKPSQIGF